MLPFLLKSFLECCDRNSLGDLIYIRILGQNIAICKRITLPKSDDVTAKSEEDRPRLTFSSKKLDTFALIAGVIMIKIIYFKP